jgi:hypothetical protein
VRTDPRFEAIPVRSTAAPVGSIRVIFPDLHIQGRLFELSRKLTFRHQYRTVLFAVVVLGGEAGTLMTIAREKTNWAAHLYVYLAMLTLGLATLYLALSGTPEQEKDAVEKNERDGTGLTERRD